MSRNVSRPAFVATHFNAEAPAFLVCEAYDTQCGLSMFMLDRWVSSDWRHVTCRNCLRHKCRALADTLELPLAFVDQAAAAIAQARNCSIAEARNRLTRELAVLAGVRDVARRARPL